MSEANAAELKDRIVQTAQRWQDDLVDVLLKCDSEKCGNHLLRRHAGAPPAGFHEDYAARPAMCDIGLMKPLPAVNVAGNLLTMRLYRPFETPPDALHLKTYRAGQPTPLSYSLSMLEHLGACVSEEQPYCIEPADTAPIWMYDFGVETIDGNETDLDKARARLEDAFMRIWSGELKNNNLSRLVLQVGPTWREVHVLRAYVRYIRQIGPTFSDAYMESALNGNPSIARALVRLFLVRFDPTLAEAERSRASETLHRRIDKTPEGVPNLDEDRILR